MEMGSPENRPVVNGGYCYRVVILLLDKYGGRPVGRKGEMGSRRLVTIAGIKSNQIKQSNQKFNI